MRFKFIYAFYRAKVKIATAESAKSLFPQCKTSVGNNSGSVEDRAMQFACSMRFSAVADRIL